MSALFDDLERGFRAQFSGTDVPRDPFAGIEMVPYDEETKPDPETVHMTRWHIERSKRQAEYDERRRRLADATPSPEFNRRSGVEV